MLAAEQSLPLSLLDSNPMYSCMLQHSMHIQPHHCCICLEVVRHTVLRRACIAAYCQNNETTSRGAWMCQPRYAAGHLVMANVKAFTQCVIDCRLLGIFCRQPCWPALLLQVDCVAKSAIQLLQAYLLKKTTLLTSWAASYKNTHLFQWCHRLLYL